MKNQHQSLQTNFINLISYAKVVLNCTKEAIKQIVSNKEYCLIDYHNSADKAIISVLEISFGNAVLWCSFDNENKCDSSYILFDNSDNKEQYIDFCNQIYPYDYLTKSWTMNNAFMVVKENKNDLIFAFFPIDNQR